MSWSLVYKCENCGDKKLVENELTRRARTSREAKRVLDLCIAGVPRGETPDTHACGEERIGAMTLVGIEVRKQTVPINKDPEEEDEG